MSILAKALSARAAFVKMKNELTDAGVDVSEVKYITDLPPVLASILPEELATQAEALLSDEGAVTALLEAFTGCANLGGIVNAIYRPTDAVGEGDLNA